MARATAQRLGLGDTTPDGAFYPKVDGKPVGENGRAFWPTKEAALAIARRFLIRLQAHENKVSH